MSGGWRHRQNAFGFWRWLKRYKSKGLSARDRQSRLWGQGPFPQAVQPDSKASDVGDEPLMLAQLTGVPVAVAPKRPQAVSLLLAEHAVDIIIADDGLQHYALGRQIEIAVVDGERGLGNGWRLPAGPLRESKRRLRKVDWVVVNGAVPDDLDDYARRLGLRKHPRKLVAMQLQQTGWRRVSDNQEIDVPDGESALAIAGIGNPERFFQFIKSATHRFTGNSGLS